MGLDAFVCCDCYERGAVNTPPPPEVGKIITLSDGSRSYEFEGDGSDELDSIFDEWNGDACEHADGRLLHHYLGNMAIVAHLREFFAPMDALKVTCERIVYSGTHSGDFLSREEVEDFAQELSLLGLLGEQDPFAEEFHQQMLELVEASRLTNKPIAF